MQNARLFINRHGSMVQFLFAIFVAVFCQFSLASDASVSVSAPIGLISSQTLAEVEKRTGLNVKLHSYQYSSSVMTSVAIDPHVFDLVLIDRSYVPLFKASGMLDQEIAQSIFPDPHADTVTETCPIYATGQTVLVSNVQHVDQEASWGKILRGEFGHSEIINFSSVTEAGEVLVDLMGNEKCVTESCTINSIASSMRIIIASSSNNDIFGNGSYSFVPDYQAKQIVQSNRRQQIYKIANYNRFWAKHWCVMKGANTDQVMAFLQELYRHENVTLNAQSTQANLIHDQRLWHDTDFDSFISFPGESRHRLHSVVVGLGQALYAE